MKKILLAFAVLAFCGAAQAQFTFSPALHYSQASIDFNGTTVDQDALSADLRFGYLFPMGFYVGAMYAYLGGAAARANSAGADSDDSGSLIGPSIGYYAPAGFNILFTYHLMGESTSSLNATENKHSGASGFQLDIGWNFPITSVFGLGPQLTYRSIEFSDYEVNGVTVNNFDYGYTSLEPYLALWFMF